MKKKSINYNMLDVFNYTEIEDKKTHRYKYLFIFWKMCREFLIGKIK